MKRPYNALRSHSRPGWAARPDRPLRNAEIRAFTDLERQQVTAILKALKSEGQVFLDGRGAGARWHLTKWK